MLLICHAGGREVISGGCVTTLEQTECCSSSRETQKLSYIWQLEILEMVSPQFQKTTNLKPRLYEASIFRRFV